MSGTDDSSRKSRAAGDSSRDANHFADLQRRFAAHIRDPATSPAPAGIEDRRLQVYRELFFNNVAGLLAGNFPVLHRVLGPDRWQQLVRDFYRDHRCHTPLFHEISQEFLAYLGEERAGNDGDPSFIFELAHYEWVELALSLDESELETERVDPGGDLMTGVPVLSPLAWPLVYRFPVHQLSPGFQPGEPPPEPSFFVACRDRDDKVRFLAVNAVTLRLVERLQQHPGLTGNEQLAGLVDELPQLDPSSVLESGRDTLEQLRTHGIVLGTRVD
jgi:hypothetical protein